jgi:hypothetical protein
MSNRSAIVGLGITPQGKVFEDLNDEVTLPRFKPAAEDDMEGECRVRVFP